MSITDNLVRRILKQANVVSKIPLAKNVFHLIIQGDDLKNLNYTPGEHLRIFIGLEQNSSFGDKVRTYSVWKYEKETGIIHLAICAHTTGPGTNWIRSLAEGQAIFLTAPKGKFVVDASADNYLFIGDTSALAHLYELRRNLPSNKNFTGIIYSKTEEELFPDIDGTFPFGFHALPENPLKELVLLCENEFRGIPENSIVYIGGDGRICVGLLNYFKKEKAWASKRIKTKPFWMPGKKGLE